MSTDTSTPPHVVRLDKTRTFALCDQLGQLSLPYGANVELASFRKSRTPYDALRLANALHHLVQSPSPAIIAAIKELDTIAAIAGLTPASRR